MGPIPSGPIPQAGSAQREKRSFEDLAQNPKKRLRRANALTTDSDWAKIFPRTAQSLNPSIEKIGRVVQSEKENIIQQARALIEQDQFLPARGLLLSIQKKTGHVLTLLQQVNSLIKAQEPHAAKKKKNAQEKMESNLLYARRQQAEEPQIKLNKHIGEVPSAFKITRHYPYPDGSVKVTTQVEEETPQISGRPVGIAFCQGARAEMEDCHLATELFFACGGNNVSCELYAVLDGHGGRKSAEFVRNHLPLFLKTSLEKHLTSDMTDEQVGSALRESFINLDNACVDFNDGTTATVALVCNEKVFAANAGDSRTNLYDQGETIQMTHDAKLSDDRFARKVKKLGGTVVRINDVLRIQMSIATAGSLGDRYVIGSFGECCVPPQPQVSVHSFKRGEAFLLMGCDGLFDVTSTNDVVPWVHHLMVEGEAVGRIAKRVVYSALKSKTNDNVTVLIAPL